MAQLLKNNVSGVLASGIGSGATAITLVDGSNFPSPTGGDYFLATLIGLNGNGQESSWEIVKVTARSTNTLTVVRAQESTTAASWTSGTTIQMRLTAGTILPSADISAFYLPLSGGTLTGKLTLPAVTTSSAPLNITNPSTGDVPSSPVNGDVWINNNGLQFRQGTTTQTVAVLGGTQTFTGATTFQGTLNASSNVNLGSNSGAATHNLGHGATTNGSTKTINIGSNGVSGSTTTINIGSNVSGAQSDVTAYGNFTAQANSGNSYASVNRSAAGVEVGYRWQSAGANVWLNYLTANDSTLRWFAAAGERMSLTTAGALTAASFSGAGTGLTGTASSLSIGGSAGSVAWTNVSGRPTAVSSFTNDSGYITSSGSITGNAGTVGGLSVHAGRNNEVNKIVRTDASGYLQVGYINSSSGNENNASNPPRVWGTNGSDDYMRTYQTSSLSVGYATNAGGINATGALLGYSYSAVNTAQAGQAGPQIQGQGSGGAVFSLHRPGSYAINVGLDSDNVFRIGGWSASSNRLQMDMSGNLTMAGNVTAYSDERLKKDWSELPQDFIERLAKVKHGTFTRIDSNERQVGVSAQSFAGLLPEAVPTDAEGMLSVAYGNAALAACVQLAQKVVELAERVKELESR